MSQTSPNTITALSTPPSTLDPSSFDTRADSFLGALPTLVTETNSATAITYGNAVDAYNNATTAATAAVSASANAVLAQTAAAAGLWVSGTTYAINDKRYSPANGRLYSRLTTGAGTTDPASDGTNWALVSPLMKQVTEARGTAAISSGVLNLDMLNGIASVTVNANITSVTLSNDVGSTTACHCFTLETIGNGTAYTQVWPAGNGTSTLLFKWAGGTAPTFTSTNGKRDSFFFKSVSQYLYDAYIIGQNS